MNEDKLQSYRQPLITATGIILGFILHFAASFTKLESSIPDFYAYIIGFCILLGALTLILVMYKILTLHYPKENPDKYYQKILKLFIFGVSISFVGVFMDMYLNFMI